MKQEGPLGKLESPLGEFTVETREIVPRLGIRLWSEQLAALEDEARAALAAAGYDDPVSMPKTFGLATIEGAALHVLGGAERLREVVARDRLDNPAKSVQDDYDARHMIRGAMLMRDGVLFGRMDDAVTLALTIGTSYAIMRTLQMEKDIKVGRAKRRLPAKLGKERQVATPEAVARWNQQASAIRASHPNLHPTRWKSEVARKIAKAEGVAITTIRKHLAENN